MSRLGRVVLTVKSWIAIAEPTGSHARRTPGRIRTALDAWSARRAARFDAALAVQAEVLRAEYRTAFEYAVTTAALPYVPGPVEQDGDR